MMGVEEEVMKALATYGPIAGTAAAQAAGTAAVKSLQALWEKIWRKFGEKGEASEKAIKALEMAPDDEEAWNLCYLLLKSFCRDEPAFRQELTELLGKVKQDSRVAQTLQVSGSVRGIAANVHQAENVHFVYHPQESQDREAAAHRRTIQSEKRERFYKLSQVIIKAADQQRRFTQSFSFPASDANKAFNERLKVERDKAILDVEDALLALSLDDAGEEINKIYREIQRASYRYTNSLEVNAQHPGEFSHEHVEGALQTMEAEIIELRERIRARLKELEEPI